MMSDSRLGALLIQEKGLDQDTLSAAEQKCKDLGGRLDTALLELGAASEEMLGELLSRAAGLPFLDLRRFPPQNARSRSFPSASRKSTWSCRSSWKAAF